MSDNNNQNNNLYGGAGIFAAIAAGILMFFFNHPKITLTLLLIPLLFAAVVKAGDIEEDFSEKIGSVNISKGVTYLPDYEIDAEECMKRIEKAIKDGKLEVIEPTTSYFWPDDELQYLRYAPAYEILHIADTYMTRLRKDSLASPANKYKIVFCENAEDLFNNGLTTDIKSSFSKDEIGYFIDTEKEIVYVWDVIDPEELKREEMYLRLKEAKGSRDEKFLRDWVNKACPSIVDTNNDRAWLEICKDSLKSYMEDRDSYETLINQFYSRGPVKSEERFNELSEELKKAEASEDTVKIVESLQKIVGKHSFGDFVYEYLVNQPYCADNYKEEVMFYDQNYALYGDEYEDAPELKMTIAKFNAYAELFPGETGENGVRPGNSMEEYREIIATRQPLIDEMNARMEAAFAENPTLRWYELVEAANLEELAEKYDVTVEKNEKYYAAKEASNVRMQYLKRTSTKRKWGVALLLLACTILSFVCFLKTKDLKRT